MLLKRRKTKASKGKASKPALTATIVFSVFIPEFSYAERSRVEVPLLGNGELAILSAGDKRVSLANIRNASNESGIVYFDHHLRVSDIRIAGDPPQNEIIYRTALDCNALTTKLISATTRNYQTLAYAEESLDFKGDKERSIDRSSFYYDICSALNNGRSLMFALVQNHYEGLENFPRYALSYRDAFEIEETDGNGKITKASESALLQYLRKHNPNF